MPRSQELKLLDRLVQFPEEQTMAGADLSVYVRKLACLGGYLARAHDPPPGNTVIWRGLSRLTEIELGFELALEAMGIYGLHPFCKKKNQLLPSGKIARIYSAC